MLAVSAAVVSDPEVAIGSVSPDVARHDFAFVLAQVTVVVLLASRSVSATESVAVGALLVRESPHETVASFGE